MMHYLKSNGIVEYFTFVLIYIYRYFQILCRSKDLLHFNYLDNKFNKKVEAKRKIRLSMYIMYYIYIR